MVVYSRSTSLVDDPEGSAHLYPSGYPSICHIQVPLEGMPVEEVVPYRALAILDVSRRLPPEPFFCLYLSA